MDTLAAIIWLLAKATAFAFAMIAAVIVIATGFGFTAILEFLRFLIENWIVQTLIGAWVVFKAQQAAAAHSRSMARLEGAYSRKIEAISSLYGLVERRLYATRRYLATIENDPSMIDQERLQYREVVQEWNVSAKMHQINVLLDYDSYFGLLLDQEFFPSFAKMDMSLRHQRIRVQNGNKPDAIISSNISSELKRLSVLALKITREMRRIADADRMILDGKAEIRLENSGLITYPQLLKALFVPRV